MSLRRLQVTDLRCLQSVSVELDHHFTLLSGPNGSGKTSMLEAIHVLGRGRSFRTRRLEQLVRRTAERFVVFGEIDVGDRRVRMGVEGEAGRLRAQISGRPASTLAELAVALPVQIIDPEVHKLIEEGPWRRRRFLDWGVFHVEPQFVDAWRRYEQGLKQRNASLRQRQAASLLAAWDIDLVLFGDRIDDARRRYVARLQPEAATLCQELLGLPLELGYYPGWSQDLDLSEALLQSRALDVERGATQVGPHRADLRVKLQGQLAKDHVSRGQQKLLAAALLIAQMKLFPADAPQTPTLLLDDPSAELDADRLAGLIRHVSLGRNQLVVTTLQESFDALGTPGVRLRVDGGRVHPV
jgi:DNA replication and repair protein RecF